MIDFIEQNVTYILIGCVAAIIALLVWNIINTIRIGKLKKKYENFMRDLGDINVEQLLNRCIEKVYRIEALSEKNEERFAALGQRIDECVQKVNIVRYNAFEHVGNDLSFSLALLDKNNDGVVITGIYSREVSSIYAKEVKDGKSSHTLSEEEKQALEGAMNS